MQNEYIGFGNTFPLHFTICIIVENQKLTIKLFSKKIILHFAFCIQGALMQLILASQSPRRKELLGLFRIPFAVQVADIDETIDFTRPPNEEVARVSRLKAEAIPHADDDVVIAADTIVVCDGKVLGKPADEEDAFRMLRMLSGKAHQVMTGMTVLYGDQIYTCTEVTDVYFRQLSEK